MLEANKGILDRSYVRFLIAPLMVLAAFLLRQTLVQGLGLELPPFITFDPAVMIVALLGGGWPGVLATALATLLADYWVLPPQGHFAIATTADAVSLAFFSGMGVFMSVVAGLYRRNVEKLADYQRELVLAATNKKLRQSEEQFRTLANSIPQLCWMSNPSGWIFWYNERWYKYTGTEAAQMEGWGWQSVHDPEVLPKVLERWKASIAVEEPFDMVFPIRGADGVFRPFLTRVMPVKDAQGKVAVWFGTNTDISGQMQVEGELRRSKERLDLALEVADMGEWELDLTNHTASRSLRHDQIFGYESLLPEWTYEMFLNHVLPEHRAEVEDRFKTSLATGTWDFEARIKRVDGEVRWIWARGRAWMDESGQPARMFGTVMDITDRKRAQEALEEGRAKLDAALASMTDAVSISDASGRFIDFNDAFATFHRFRSKAECARELSDYPDILDVSTADRELLPLEQWAVPRALRGETGTNVEYFLRRKDTGEAWAGSYSFNPIRDSHGAIVGSVVVGRDITESKLAEEALRESEERLRSLGDNLPDSYVYQYTHTKDGRPRFLYLSAGVEKLHGVKASEVLRDARVLQDRIEPEQLAAMEEEEEVSLRNMTDFKIELRMRHSDGQWRWFKVRSRPRRKSDGQLFWDGVVTDITEGKRAQEELRESEVLYRSLFNSMDEGFCIIEMIFDPEGKPVDYRFLEVNTAFERQTGLHEAEGKRMRELAPSHEAHWFDIYGKIALTGEPAHFENEAKALNRYYEVSAYRIGEPELRQVAIVFNDISRRKRADEELRSALEEKTALLKEVHHRVKNNLQIVSSLLNLQARRVKNDAALETLRDTQGRIRSMALLHETLYREGNAAAVNCVAYFRHLCTHLCHAFGEMSDRVRVSTDIAPVNLGIDIAIPCGLIINELVSNSFKHAFPDGRRGEIAVRVLDAEAEGRIVLSVADDGIGLRPGDDYLQNGTLGTQLVTGLARQIAAAIEVTSDMGTKVQISFQSPDSGGLVV